MEDAMQTEITEREEDGVSDVTHLSRCGCDFTVLPPAYAYMQTKVTHSYIPQLEFPDTDIEEHGKCLPKHV